MLVLGLQGSPRIKKGNSRFLLSTFLNEAEKLGAKTHIIEADRKKIIPCKEYLVCEKKGFCPIDDDMAHEVYHLLRQADVIILATPIFFYSTTAQLKTIIDRSQALWARKYRLKLIDPARKYRRGFLLALGATKGINLFEPINLTAKYFFDAVGANFYGSLTYNQIEYPGDMERHPTVVNDVKEAAKNLIEPLNSREKVIFISNKDSCRTQMASAFLQYYAGDKIEATSAGISPDKNIDALMIEVMEEKGIDMAFRKNQNLQSALNDKPPDTAIYFDSIFDSIKDLKNLKKTKTIKWDIQNPIGKSKDIMRDTRDRIEEMIGKFIARGS